MPLRDMLRDRVTLVKKDGDVARENIKAQVSSDRIITFDVDLPIEPGDHFLRKLPSGLVEDYEIDDPCFRSGLHPIPDSYQAKVHRSGKPAAPQQQIVQSITAHFHAANARITVGTDNSINVVYEIQPLEVASFIEQLKPHLAALPEPVHAQLMPQLAILESEVRTPKPNQTTLRSTLQSVRTIVEGAAGNLVAAGILAKLAPLLAG